MTLKDHPQDDNKFTTSGFGRVVNFTFNADIDLRAKCLQLAFECAPKPIKDGTIIMVAESFYNWILNKEPQE